LKLYTKQSNYAQYLNIMFTYFLLVKVPYYVKYIQGLDPII